MILPGFGDGNYVDLFPQIREVTDFEATIYNLS